MPRWGEWYCMLINRVDVVLQKILIFWKTRLSYTRSHARTRWRNVLFFICALMLQRRSTNRIHAKCQSWLLLNHGGYGHITRKDWRKLERTLPWFTPVGGVSSISKNAIDTVPEGAYMHAYVYSPQLRMFSTKITLWNSHFNVWKLLYFDWTSTVTCPHESNQQ